MILKMPPSGYLNNECGTTLRVVKSSCFNRNIFGAGDISLPILRALAHQGNFFGGCFLSLACLTAVCHTAVSDDQPTSSSGIKHQITGLFSADREKDLHDVFENLPDFKLVKIDFENAEATIEYDPAKVFPGAKPEQIVEQFDNRLKGASNHTFGVKPLRTIEKDKLKRIEILVAGLDCKACSLGAYDAIYRLKGVECATASFKGGRVTALINPEMIDRTELEMALKQRGVEIKMDADSGK